MFAAIAARFALTAGMKGFLGTFGKPLLIMIAIGLAIVFIDQRGFHRAKEQDRLRQLERQAITRAVVQAIDADLDKKLATITATVAGKIETIDTEGKTVVQPLITRELIRDSGLADPGRCLSPGLLEAVNAARGHIDQRLAPAGAGARSGNPPPVPRSNARH